MDDQILAAFAPLEDEEDGGGQEEEGGGNPLKRGLGDDDIFSSEEANRPFFSAVSSSTSMSVSMSMGGSMHKKANRSSEITNVTSNVVWMQKMDELLKDAVMKYQDDWMAISEAVRTQLSMLSLEASSSSFSSSSTGSNAAQIPVQEVSPPLPAHPDPMECMERWNQLQYEKVPTWTEHEVGRSVLDYLSEQSAYIASTAATSVYLNWYTMMFAALCVSMLCDRLPLCSDW